MPTIAGDATVGPPLQETICHLAFSLSTLAVHISRLQRPGVTLVDLNHGAPRRTAADVTRLERPRVAFLEPTLSWDTCNQTIHSTMNYFDDGLTLALAKGK